MVYELSNMSWVEAEGKFKETDLAIVPTGATEQHGLHLGLGSDWIIAWEIARRVGERTDALVLPVMPYGVSGHHGEFPGVMTLEAATFQRVIYELLASLHRYGIRRVIFINGHGGNLAALSEAAKEARDRHGMICAISMWWEALQHKPIFGQPAEAHAGYGETALMLATRPEAVKMERAELSPTRQVDDEIQLVRAGLAKFRDGLVRIVLKTADVSDTGSMTEALPDAVPGTTDYSPITEAFSRGLMEEIVDWTCGFVQRFRAFELPPLRVSREAAMKALKTK